MGKTQSQSNNESKNKIITCRCLECSKGKNILNPESKCSLCRCKIKLDDTTAITRLSVHDNFLFTRDIDDKKSENIHNLRGFNVLGHNKSRKENHDYNCSKYYNDFLCKICQTKTKTLNSSNISREEEFKKNLGYIPNTRIQPFTYFNNDDKKTYFVAGITLDIYDADLVICLSYHLNIPDPKTDNDKLIHSSQFNCLIQLFSLRLRNFYYDYVLDQHKSRTDKLIATSLMNEKKRNKMTKLLDCLREKEFGYISVTGLPKPLIKIIYGYNPYSRYSKFFTELPS